MPNPISCTVGFSLCNGRVINKMFTYTKITRQALLKIHKFLPRGYTSLSPTPCAKFSFTTYISKKILCPLEPQRSYRHNLNLGIHRHAFMHEYIYTRILMQWGITVFISFFWLELHSVFLNISSVFKECYAWVFKQQTKMF